MGMMVEIPMPWAINGSQGAGHHERKARAKGEKGRRALRKGSGPPSSPLPPHWNASPSRTSSALPSPPQLLFRPPRRSSTRPQENTHLEGEPWRARCPKNDDWRRCSTYSRGSTSTRMEGSPRYEVVERSRGTSGRLASPSWARARASAQNPTTGRPAQRIRYVYVHHMFWIHTLCLS